MKVEGIFRYPVKSLGGESLEQVFVKEEGLAFDREWMIIDEDNVMLTQRENPKMSMIKAQIIDDQILRLTTPENDKFQVGVRKRIQAYVDTNVWKSKVSAQMVSARADSFLSSYLNQKVSLVSHGKYFKRNRYDRLNRLNFNTFFSDGYPILLANTKSLEDLNGRLKNPIDMDRFRANIVCTFKNAFDEDDFNKISIDGHELLWQNKRKRCSMVNIEQTDASYNKEPMQVLATYRKIGGGVCFGVSLLSLSDFHLKLGMDCQTMK